MDLGVSLPVAGAWATTENVRAVARAAEDLGYRSLWTFHRLLYAQEPQNEYPQAPGQPWPYAFESVLDPIATMAYAAAITARVRIGVAVLNVPFFTPIVLAKQLAAIDLLSQGRLDAGVGLGWSRDEFAAVGVPYERRGARGNEFLECLIAIWTQDVVEFDGEFYRVPAARVLPKPVQQPHPPLLVGGFAPVSVHRAVRYGQGFVSGNMALDAVQPLLSRLQDAAEEAGRDPGSLRLVSRGVVRLLEEPGAADRRPLWGTLDQIREDVERYREAGLSELFLEFNFDPEINGAGADPEQGLRRALAVMEALSPTR